ncbi:MAG: formamidopyrimidine-DNA glycosylase [Deltaproteobacteria bacterium]|nr:MAG: formamidopyrimidine-DNA glycosylase [Deltaproteobacteria bacterium]
MPELPEAEHARRTLSRQLQDRRLVQITAQDPAVVRTSLSSRPSDAVEEAAKELQRFVGSRVGEALRWGKRLALPFEREGLLIHLGMSGRFVVGDTAPRHARLTLQAEDGPTVWFDDPRRFGCVVPSPLPLPLRAGLGPDPIHEPPDGAALQERLDGRQAIKTALLDQRRLAGLGNIQATEALWRARIAPSRRCPTLSPAEWRALAEGIASSLHDTFLGMSEGEIVYVSADKERNPFAIYGRGRQPCPACDAPLVTDRLGGRATTWCRACQK